MKTNTPQPAKVSVTIHITKAAQNILFDNGYASQRTVGMFISELIMEHHARQTRKPTKEEIAQELHKLADLVDNINEVNQVAPIASEPMPLANVIDAPSDLVGVTVISEEPGER
jgi:DNA-directed RNA polymerase sigma subunit (sigma70/sigma32)